MSYSLGPKQVAERHEKNDKRPHSCTDLRSDDSQLRGLTLLFKKWYTSRQNSEKPCSLTP